MADISLPHGCSVLVKRPPNVRHISITKRSTSATTPLVIGGGGFGGNRFLVVTISKKNPPSYRKNVRHGGRRIFVSL